MYRDHVKAAENDFLDENPVTYTRSRASTTSQDRDTGPVREVHLPYYERLDRLTRTLRAISAKTSRLRGDLCVTHQNCKAEEDCRKRPAEGGELFFDMQEALETANSVLCDLYDIEYAFGAGVTRPVFNDGVEPNSVRAIFREGER